MYGWGDCEQRQLGTCDSEIQFSPKLLFSVEDGKRPLFAVAGGEHTMVVCEHIMEHQQGHLGIERQLLDTSSESSLVEGSATKPCLPGGKDVDNRHGSGLRPMKLPSLLQIVQAKIAKVQV